MIYGTDVSEHQGLINWSAYDLDFVFVRCGDGYDVADRYGPFNRLMARRAGKAVGHYQFCRPAEFPGDLAADVALAQMGGPQAGEPIALDLEVDAPNLIDFAHAYALRIKQETGKPPLIYTNRDFLSRYDFGPLAALDCGLWLASWDNSVGRPQQISPWLFAACKQYQVAPGVAGISGDVDRDVFYGSVETFRLYGP